jgi:hypothetical protein
MAERTIAESITMPRVDGTGKEIMLPMIVAIGLKYAAEAKELKPCKSVHRDEALKPEYATLK